MTDSLIERLRKLCTWGVPMVDGKSRTDGLMEAAATMAKQAERIADLEMEVSGIATKNGTIKLQAAQITELERQKEDWRTNFRALEKAIVGETGLSAMTVAAQARKYRPLYEDAIARLAAYQSTPSPTDPVREAAGELLEKIPNPIFDNLKGPLIGEFSQSEPFTDEDGSEDAMRVTIEWTVTKEIIEAALRAIAETEEGEG